MICHKYINKVHTPIHIENITKNTLIEYAHQIARKIPFTRITLINNSIMN